MIRTRMAPSPTGADLHIGSIYTAYLNYVYAKKHGGKFILRIEDTDRTRYVEGAEEQFMKSLANYGIEVDEGPAHGGPFGPYRQSERLEIYKKYAFELVEKGHAYICTCTKERLDTVRDAQKAAKQIPRYDGHCKTAGLTKDHVQGAPFVIRMRMPEAEDIVIHDVIRGDITINTRDLDDQVLLKADGYPTYHLAVVVDDSLMQITHVMRAEEWINSTPKHILLYRYFGWKIPVFCHVPLLRNPDKSKLSKRKNPVWSSWFLSEGYLPDALVNYLSLMGWTHPDQKEIFDRAEFARLFDIKDLKAVGPAFDIKKLEWMNGEYIRAARIENLKLMIEKYLKECKPEASELAQKKSELFEKSLPLVKERIKKLSDYWPMCEFFYVRPMLREFDMKSYSAQLQATSAKLQAVGSWNAMNIGDAMQSVCDELGMKKSEYFMMMRVAITGKKISPPLNESMELLGREECVERIKATLNQMS